MVLSDFSHHSIGLYLHRVQISLSASQTIDDYITREAHPDVTNLITSF